MFRKLSKVKVTVLVAVTALALSAPLMVGAASTVSGSVLVVKNEIIKGNFIKAGNTIDIAGNVAGDVIVAGSSITISGDVAGDVIAAGSTVRILGTVGGSVRAVGSAIVIDNDVAHNVWAAGSTVAVGEKATIGWDVFAAGASVEIRGNVKQNVWLTGKSLLINGTVSGNVNAMLNRDGQLILNSRARVMGNISYTAVRAEQLVQQTGAVVTGTVTKHDSSLPAEKDVRHFVGAAGMILKLFGIFSLLIIGLVFTTLLPKLVMMVKDEMLSRPWPAVGRGAVFLVMVPVVALFLAITFVGLPLALILIPVYLIAMCVAKVFASLTIGVVIIDKLTKNQYHGSLVWPLLLGLVVLMVIGSIPLLGWAVGLLAVLWALGAMIKVHLGVLKEYR